MDNGRYVEQLTRDELNELKQAYVCEVVDDPSYGELADSVDIPDGVIFQHYGDYTFSEDDFFCNQHNYKKEENCIMKYCIEEPCSAPRDFYTLHDFLKAVYDLATTYEEQGDEWMTVIVTNE